MNRKILTPLFVPMMLLASCNNEVSYVGTYSFMMGKDNGSHIGIKLELSGDDFVEEGKEEPIGKKFSLTLDSTINGEPAEPETAKAAKYRVLDEESTDSSIPDDSAASDMIANLGNFKIDGAYNVTNTLTEDKNYVVDLYVSVVSELTESLFSDIPVNLLNEVVQAEINKSSVKFTIPVSVNDILFQLYWYGYDFRIYSLELVEVEKHPHGTHPTKEDIDKINETYPSEHEILGFSTKYRDFHDLTMELKKDK